MKAARDPHRGNVWIVGFGNRHRRDDGIGPYVADRLQRRFAGTPGVEVAALHQLAPELADDLQTAARVVFIDAAIGPLTERCRWRKVRPVLDLHAVGHGLTANTLLGLVALLYRRCPPAWMVAVGGSDFGFGEGLSAAAARRAERAVGEISRVVRRTLRSDAACRAAAAIG